MSNNNQYIDPNINTKMVINILLWMVFGFLSMMSCFLVVTLIFALFDGDEGAIAVWGLSIIVACATIYPAIRSIKKASYIRIAKRCSWILNEHKTPFIKLEEIRIKDQANSKTNYSYSTYGEAISIKSITQAIKFGYLRNCAVEFHDGVPIVAMKKKIIKDKCPYCGAPITGVYGEVYTCEYCGRRIENVIVKGISTPEKNN